MTDEEHYAAVNAAWQLFVAQCHQAQQAGLRILWTAGHGGGPLALVDVINWSMVRPVAETVPE